VRRHLGFETQRQWSDNAIERTSPCLLALFSLVVLIAIKLHPQNLPIRRASWYDKQEATFSNALFALRNHLWGLEHFTISPIAAALVQLSVIACVACRREDLYTDFSLRLSKTA